ncbi:MAG: nitroreductase family protein [Candidatus Heimdallarchaeota archaeon]
MPISGINYERCTICKDCIKDCPSNNYSLDKTTEKIVFESSGCISCGHCIAICPEDAILYEDMKDQIVNYKKDEDPSQLVPFDAIYQFFRSKRSIRQYKQEKVPSDQIEKVIDSMRYAPTGANLRMIKCLIISDKTKIKSISELIANAHQTKEIRERFRLMLERGVDPIFYNAPHVLIFYSKNPYDFINVAITMTYGMLSAHSLGLGSCWIGFAQGILLDNHELRRKTTGIETYVLGVMTLGYPAVKYHRTPPRPPLEITQIEDS